MGREVAAARGPSCRPRSAVPAPRERRSARRPARSHRSSRSSPPSLAGATSPQHVRRRAGVADGRPRRGRGGRPPRARGGDRGRLRRRGPRRRRRHRAARRPAADRAPGAAWANGVLANVLDYDDGHRITKGHPGAMVIPAALAAAEATGADLRRADGGGRGRLRDRDPGRRAPARARGRLPRLRRRGARWARRPPAAGCWVSTASGSSHAIGLAEYHAPIALIMRSVADPAMTKDATAAGARCSGSARRCWPSAGTPPWPAVPQRTAADWSSASAGTCWRRTSNRTPAAAGRSPGSPPRSAVQGGRLAAGGRVDGVTIDTFAAAEQLSRAAAAHQRGHAVQPGLAGGGGAGGRRLRRRRRARRVRRARTWRRSPDAPRWRSTTPMTAAFPARRVTRRGGAAAIGRPAGLGRGGGARRAGRSRLGGGDRAQGAPLPATRTTARCGAPDRPAGGPVSGRRRRRPDRAAGLRPRQRRRQKDTMAQAPPAQHDQAAAAAMRSPALADGFRARAAPRTTATPASRPRTSPSCARPACSASPCPSSDGGHGLWWGDRFRDYYEVLEALARIDSSHRPAAAGALPCHRLHLPPRHRREQRGGVLREIVENGQAGCLGGQRDEPTQRPQRRLQLPS